MRARLPIAMFVLAPLAAYAQGKPSSSRTFDQARFSFQFEYEPSWIPSVQADGESVTFTLSEGEVHVSAQRDPNPRRAKTRAALADEYIATWRNRLDFSTLDKKDATLGGLPATLVTGTAKLFDAPMPYKLALYVVEKDGRLYTVKYSGLYDPSLPYWSGFERLTRTFKFRDLPPRTAAATPAPTGTPAPVPAP